MLSGASSDKLVSGVGVIEIATMLFTSDSDGGMVGFCVGFTSLSGISSAKTSEGAEFVGDGIDSSGLISASCQPLASTEPSEVKRNTAVSPGTSIVLPARSVPL